MPDSLKVLLITESPLEAREALDAFRERGHTVSTANNGLDGLALCLKEQPDVIFTEVMLKRMDGWQLLRIIRAHPFLGKTSVFFMDPLGSEEDQELGRRLGVTGYVGGIPEALSTVGTIFGSTS